MNPAITTDVTAPALGRSAAIDVESFDFAGPLRRLAAGAINIGSGALLLVALVVVSIDSQWISLAFMGAWVLFHLAFIVVSRNSFGGWVAGCVPVSYRGELLPRMVFIGREWTFQLWLGVFSFLAQFAVFPVNALLKNVFGDVPLLTSSVRWDGDGLNLRLGSVGEWLVSLAFAAWVLRDFARGPYHQAFHDRFVHSLVVRTRTTKSDDATP